MKRFGLCLLAIAGLFSSPAFAQQQLNPLPGQSAPSSTQAAPPVQVTPTTAPALPIPPVAPAAPASPAVAFNPATATIVTSLGTIMIALDSAHAPRSVANFLQYAREGHFDGTVIYRVAPGFVLQMGSYEANGTERPAHPAIPLESGNSLSNIRGSVAMARDSDPDTAAAEFFINLADNTRLDAKPEAPLHTTGYAVFGKVISGMDVVDKIAGVPLGGQGGPFPPESTPITPVTIEKVMVSPPA